MSDEGSDSGVDRRRFLAGTATVGAALAIAGCVGEEGDGNGDGGKEGPRVGFSTDTLAPEEEFMVQSLEYQTKLIDGDDAGDPPSMGFDSNAMNDRWSFIMESLAYQNERLKKEL